MLRYVIGGSAEFMADHESVIVKKDEEFRPLLTGESARNAITTADACTRSRFENRKVKLSEITGK